MKYRRYPAYKESGVAWLGEVPAHWEVRRLRYCCQVRNEKTSALDAILPYLGLENIESWTGKSTTAGVTIESEGTASQYHPGDVLFGKLRPYLAKVLECHERGICTTELLVLKPVTTTSTFLKYQLLNDEFIRIVDSSTYGSKMPRASWDFIGNIPITTPPLAEQTAIAAFLDRETAKIDALLARQERLIALLQEKRQALISHVVTKGLNPHAAMKESGVGWLGAVPAHWEVKRNKLIFQEVDDRSVTGTEELLSVSHITGVTPRSEKTVNMFMAETLAGYKRSQPGDLVINTMWAYMGALGTSRILGLVSPSYNVYRPRRDESIHPQYLDYLYRTPQHITEIGRYSRGVWESRLRLYPDAFFVMQTPLPPRSEQDEIVEYARQKDEQYATAEKRCLNCISLLQERRAALISAAVTGAIDVRC